MLHCAFKCSGLYTLKSKHKKGFQISRVIFFFWLQRNHSFMLNNICAAVVVFLDIFYFSCHTLRLFSRKPLSFYI